MDVIWEPTAEVLERANVVRLMRRLGVDDYWELVRRSSEEPEWFWPAAIEDMGIEFSSPWEQVYDDSRGPEWTTWFVGGKVNIARVCVHDWARRTPDAVAAVLRGENGDRREWTYAELSQKVTRFAEALVSLGVEPGDRVAIFMPMAPAMAVASHACAHIGAVQVPIFSGFAAPAIAQRLQDAEAKVLVTASHSFRRGREMPMRAIADEAVAESPSVEHVVEWDRGDGAVGRRARAGRAAAARGRLGASVSPDLHVGDDRQAEGRPPRPGRLPRLDRARGRLPGGRPSRRRHPLRHRHGLDHGPVDGGGRRRDGLLARLHGGRARLAARPAVEADRGGAREHPRLLADAHPGADPERASPTRICPRCGRS